MNGLMTVKVMLISYRNSKLFQHNSILGRADGPSHRNFGSSS